MVEVRLEEGEKEPPGTECRQFLKDKEDKEVDYPAKPLTASTQANTLTLARRVCSASVLSECAFGILIHSNEGQHYIFNIYLFCGHACVCLSECVMGVGGWMFTYVPVSVHTCVKVFM